MKGKKRRLTHDPDAVEIPGSRATEEQRGIGSAAIARGHAVAGGTFAGAAAAQSRPHGLPGHTSAADGAASGWLACGWPAPAGSLSLVQPGECGDSYPAERRTGEDECS